MSRFMVAMIVASCGGASTVVPPPLAESTTPSVQPTATPSATPPASSSVPPSSPKTDMSIQLGGMKLGMTVEEFIATCRAAQGEAMRVDTIELGCSLVPSPLKTAGPPPLELPGQIFGSFCGPGATLCELMYSVTGDVAHRDEQVRSVTGMLAAKYGAAMHSEGYPGDEPMRECVRTRTAFMKRTWIFGPKQDPPHPFGWARVVFNCDLRGRESTLALTLFYDDEHGFRRRQAQAREGSENY